MQTDEQCVHRASQGDREAFEELVRRTARSVYVRIYMEVGNVADAEDLVQETFLRAFRSIKQVTRPEGLRPWLYTIARTAVLDFQRKGSRKKRSLFQRGFRRDHSAVLDQMAATREEEGERPEQRERREKVRSALQSLPEEYRLPLMLRYLEGANCDRIAQQLGVTNGSIRGMLHRGLRALGERLKKEAVVMDGGVQ